MERRCRLCGPSRWFLVNETRSYSTKFLDDYMEKISRRAIMSMTVRVAIFLAIFAARIGGYNGTLYAIITLVLLAKRATPDINNHPNRNRGIQLCRKYPFDVPYVTMCLVSAWNSSPSPSARCTVPLRPRPSTSSSYSKTELSIHHGIPY
jgi:hypothetical protein